MAKMTAAEKEKRTPKFLRKLFESPKKKTERLKFKNMSNVDSGRGGKDSARQKMMDKDSMFAKAAKNRDDAKVAPGKKRSFKEAFDSATKAGKSKFMLGGKGYLTTKGKREDRFDPTKIKGSEKKESIFSKFKSSKTGVEFFKKLKKKK